MNPEAARSYNCHLAVVCLHLPVKLRFTVYMYLNLKYAAQLQALLLFLSKGIELCVITV